ncbi:DUF2066 domain-containing protein [Candidatus Foliamicus sp.]
MLARILPQAFALTLVLACAAAGADTPFRSVAPLQEPGRAGEESALQDALGRLLIRVTGRRDATDLLERFPPAPSIVRHYQVIDGTRLEAEFDAALVRRVLEAADVGIWEEERPKVVLWLVINDGGRWLFQPSESSTGAARTLDARIVFSGAISRTLDTVSALRGIELNYAPAPDSGAARQCAEQVWAGSFACIPETDAQLLMLGRASIPSAPEDIEWSLRENGQWGPAWESTAAEAVHSVTDMLAARYMATQGPTRAYLLVVSPVPDLGTYARLRDQLGAMAAVREWRVDSAAHDSLSFRITSRTAEALLREALASLGVPFELRRAE